MSARSLNLKSLSLLVAALLTSSCGPTTTTTTPPPDTATVDESGAIRHLTVGIAFLEQHRFKQAEEEFKAALELRPDYVEARIDLAIALAAEVLYGEAVEQLEAAIAVEKNNPTALYMLGIIHKYQGEKDEALAAFEAVREIDPTDTDTLYNLATLYKDRREFDKAIPLLEEVIEASPYFASAYYAVGQAYLRYGQETKDPEHVAAGQRYIERFQELSGGSNAETAGLRYGEQGRYSMAVEDRSALAPVAATEFTFTDATESLGILFEHGGASEGLSALGSGVLIYDIDGDLDDDILLVGSAKGGAARLYRNEAGVFTDETDEAGLATVTGPVAGVAAGDVDADGVTDLLFGGRLLRGTEEGKFIDITKASGLDSGVLTGAASISFVDLDHDGDLDIAATLPASGIGIWQNDATGVFTAAASSGLTTEEAAVSLTFTDFDLDRDLDAVVGIDGGRTLLFTNLRGLKFKEVGVEAALTKTGSVRGISVGDTDRDGWMDLLLTNTDGTNLLLRNQRNRQFGSPTRLDTPGLAAGCLLFDADLDGDEDVLIGHESGVSFFRNDGTDGFTEQTSAVGLNTVSGDIRGIATGDLDGDGDLDVVLNRYHASAIVLRNDGAEKNSWVRVAVRGLSSNTSGLGTKVDIRSGRLSHKAEVRGASGFLSQSTASITFGLGSRTTIDRLRMLWPGGVLQAEIDLPPGKTHVLEELDRKGSSCPFLWAWSGDELVFVSDIQGGSPLGLWVGAGPDGNAIRNLPDPEEWFLLPRELMEPRSGLFDLRITESLEEVAYLDRAMLRVVDAPAGVDVFPNERLLMMPPFAREKLHLVASTMPLREGRGDDGSDVTEQLRTVDRTYAGAAKRQPFRGFAEPWTIELDFGIVPESARTGDIVLLAHGWIEFSNSTPMYAAGQAGKRLELPRLEILDDDGQVLSVIENAGAPAGLPKWMVLELTDHLPPSGRVRLRYSTSLEVYFDQVLLGLADPNIEHAIYDIEPTIADLGWKGYPTLWSPDGNAPQLYRYGTLKPEETWQTQEGLYTRYGDVGPLLGAADDLQVVMVHGDELRLGFSSADLPALAPGNERSFILYSVGYAKDLDGMSAGSENVGPLPYLGMPSYPYPGLGRFANPAYVAEVEKWSTRYVRPTAGTLR